jgi:hypothetical protein
VLRVQRDKNKHPDVFSGQQSYFTNKHAEVSSLLVYTCYKECVLDFISHTGFLGPTQPLNQRVTRFFPGVKQPWHGVNHSAPSSAKVKNACSYTSAPTYTSQHEVTTLTLCMYIKNYGNKADSQKFNTRQEHFECHLQITNLCNLILQVVVK